MSEIEDLKKELQALKDQVNPPPRPPSTWQPIDRTAGMTMPANALRAMVDAVPESVMRELRADARKPNPVQASTSTVASTPAAQSQPQKRGSGWIEPRPLESPPGLKYVDAQLDAQDAKDRVELAHKLAQVELSKRRGEKGETK